MRQPADEWRRRSVDPPGWLEDGHSVAAAGVRVGAPLRRQRQPGGFSEVPASHRSWQRDAGARSHGSAKAGHGRVARTLDGAITSRWTRLGRDSRMSGAHETRHLGERRREDRSLPIRHTPLRAAWGGLGPTPTWVGDEPDRIMVAMMTHGRCPALDRPAPPYGRPPLSCRPVRPQQSTHRPSARPAATPA